MEIAGKINPIQSDDRGSITQLLPETINIKSVLLITCNKGSIRANHWHKKDTHYVYMLKGRMRYYYQNLIIQNSKRKSIIVRKGEIVYTPSGTAHSMKFLENSVFLALSTQSREQKKYEKDTIRVKLI